MLVFADLLKVRAQAIDPATGRPFYHYPNPWKALGQIYSQEGGFAALYRWGPNAVAQLRPVNRPSGCQFNIIKNVQPGCL